MDKELERLQIHIDGLQVTLGKRNARIEKLEQEVERLKRGDVLPKELRREYTRGWKDCANEMMNSTQQIARILGHFRRDAFDLLLQGEREERETS